MTPAQPASKSWRVLLNDRELGRLRVDENDMLVHFAIPPRTLVDGPNRLRVDQDERRGKIPDDIRIGSVILDTRPLSSVLSEATVEIDVVDADSREHLPARITVVDRHGTMQTVGAVSNDHLAVRVGIVYTASGVARFGLPAGVFIWVERKMSGRIQDRLGPTRCGGRFGWLQSLVALSIYRSLLKRSILRLLHLIQIV